MAGLITSGPFYYLGASTMKRLLVIGLLLLLCIHLLGFYCYFVFRIVEITQESRKQLESVPIEKLERFEMSTAQFESVRTDDHEVRVDGRLFDICKVKVSGDTVVMYALHDGAEEDLILGLKVVLKHGMSDTKPIPAAFLSYFHLNFLLTESSIEYPAPLLFSGETKYMEFPALFEPLLTTPPPRV